MATMLRRKTANAGWRLTKAGTPNTPSNRGGEKRNRLLPGLKSWPERPVRIGVENEEKSLAWAWPASSGEPNLTQLYQPISSSAATTGTAQHASRVPNPRHPSLLVLQARNNPKPGRKTRVGIRISRANPTAQPDMTIQRREPRRTPR